MQESLASCYTLDARENYIHEWPGKKCYTIVKDSVRNADVRHCIDRYYVQLMTSLLSLV